MLPSYDPHLGQIMHNSVINLDLAESEAKLARLPARACQTAWTYRFGCSFWVVEDLTMVIVEVLSWKQLSPVREMATERACLLLGITNELKVVNPNVSIFASVIISRGFL